TKNKEGEEIIDPRRYEILVYRQIIKQIQTGALHVESSTKHKTFYHELNQFEKKEDALETLNIPWLKKPCKEQVPLLLAELNMLWIEVNDKLNKDDLKHIKYDKDNNKILWVNPKIINEEKEERQTLYNKIPICDVADMLRFVNKETGFFSSFTPLQPRCKKQKIDEDNIIAVLISQATNVGNYKMAQTSDISYRTLETTYQQYMRLATLRKANDTIANAISRLPIFPYYLFDLDLLYGSLDGQKYDMLTPTVKARHSKKNFTKGRGVSAYTLLSNHVPINCELIGSHDHESYFAFDFWYNNTSLIKPTILTSDMHGINQANFALLHWFGAEFRPRFTNLKTAIKNTCCGSDLAYGDFLVAPEEIINEQLIYDEEENINNIVKSLALKDLNQSTLIKKLCLLPTKNKTRQAVAEFDVLVRSIYTLKCILHPEMLVNVHRSQNRIESYHNLRAAIARVGGTKALLGQTDLEAEVSNQSNRLITTAIIYYNSVILSCLLNKNIPLNKKKKLLKIIKKSSPVAWQHFHFTGHFLFYSNKKIISIKDIIESLEF
ncbi:MAG: Tn3 family transposase, partial [Candidatus Magasanikbacteria bacterium]|nr:Tn3 family transposase [Candidatus Magasanikbacteria bacterium]